jgi:glycosyltransferase involved in cell wall biosynthesis
MEFTVLIPVFNTKPDALMEAVSCIVNQTVKAKKIIVIDDGSTDPKTFEMLEVINRSPDVHVMFMEVNEGTSGALNRGHLMVNTEWVAIMGSDDVCHPERFAKQVKYLEAHPNVDVIGTQLFSFKADDITRRSIFKSSHQLRPTSIKDGWIVNHGTVMYRNSAVAKAGGYDLSKRRGQDVDLWRRMWAKGFKFANIQEILYGWRRYK